MIWSGQYQLDAMFWTKRTLRSPSMAEYEKQWVGDLSKDY